MDAARAMGNVRSLIPSQYMCENDLTQKKQYNVRKLTMQNLRSQQ